MDDTALEVADDPELDVLVEPSNVYCQATE
jgi:hypothetical protein